MILKIKRQEKCLTSAEACKRLRLSRSSLQRYERLSRFPDNKILKRFKRTYNLSDKEIADIFLEYFYTSI